MKRLVILLLLLLVPRLALAEEPLALDVEKSVRLAIENNYVLAQERARIDEAKARLEAAKAPGRLQLSSNTNLTRTNPLPSFGGRTIANEYSYLVRVAFDQLISNFGRLQDQVRAAALDVDRSEEQYQQALGGVVRDVKRSYFQVLEAQGARKVAQADVASREAHVKRARDLFEVGVAPRFDVLSQESQLLLSRQTLLRAQHLVDLARARFLDRAGIPLDSSFTLAETSTLPDLTRLALPALQEAAKTTRPEARVAETSVDIGRQLVSLAGKGMNGSVSFGTQMDYQTASAFGVPFVYRLMVIYAQPLGDGGLTKARVQEARAILRRLESARGQVYRDVALEVQEAWLDLQEARARLESAAKNVETAEEALRVAEVRFTAGVGTSVELDDAQRSFSRASVDQVTAFYDVQVALANLSYAVGTDVLTLQAGAPAPPAETPKEARP